MNQLEHFKEIVASYRKHGWQLRRVLMCEETRGHFAESSEPGFEGLIAEVAEVDALWFARPSHAGREAWELRHVSETPYALFEAFEADVSEELRSEMLRDMEARLVEYALRD